MNAFVILLNVAFVGWRPAEAWGSSSSNSDFSDSALFGSGLDRSWLYDSTSISLKLEGCMWGFVGDSEDAGCLEDSSEDGTTYWYQMANCRRAQAIYSLYASSGSTTSCQSSTFQETLMTTGGLSEFIYYLREMDANNPFGDYQYGYDDDAYDDDGGNYDGGDGDDGYDNLPMCEEANGYYIGIGCSEDGRFSLQYYDDQYCLSPSGSTYDNLRQLNRVLKNYKSCSGIWYYGNDDGNDGSLPQVLVASSNSCSYLDSNLCTDSEVMTERESISGSSGSSTYSVSAVAGKSWVTKLKYVAGGLLMLASFVMFTGILFTNRRRRRALMQRKYKNRAREERSRRSRHSSRSKSKSRSDRGSQSRRRSKSKNKDDGEGVYT